MIHDGHQLGQALQGDHPWPSEGFRVLGTEFRDCGMMLAHDGGIEMSRLAIQGDGDGLSLLNSRK